MAASAITTATFLNGLKEHRLIGSRSATGGAVFVPPRQIDPLNVAAEMETVQLSGKGTLVSFSVVPIASSEMIAAGYGKENPHCVGIVKLEEGASVCAQIIGIDVRHPESIELGMPMRAEFIERRSGETTTTVLAFRPD
jgi:uncharacterized protein